MTIRTNGIYPCQYVYVYVRHGACASLSPSPSPSPSPSASPSPSPSPYPYPYPCPGTGLDYSTTVGPTPYDPDRDVERDAQRYGEQASRGRPTRETVGQKRLGRRR